MKMLKLPAILMLICTLSWSSVSAQEENYSQGKLAYEKGDFVINAGISFGLIGYGYGYYGSRSFSVPLTATVDYGATDEFSFGGFIGYYGTSYGPKGNRYGFRNFSFGAQGTFHATAIMNEAFDMDIDEKKVDYYVRLMLGYETFSWTYNGKSYSDFYYDNQTSGRLVFAPVLGVRYMFNPNLGVYVEGGRGTYGYLTLGLSVKF